MLARPHICVIKNKILSECWIDETRGVLLPAPVGSYSDVNKWKSLMTSGLQTDIINCCTCSSVSNYHCTV